MMVASYKILNERESAAVLLARLPAEDQALYNKFGHNKVVPIFLDRILYLYKCAGKGQDGQQRSPEIHAKIRVINFGFGIDEGFTIVLLNETTNEKQTLTVTPTRLFGFDVFANVPNSFTLRFNQLVWDDGKAQFDTSAVIYVKTANKSDFYSYKNFYLEPPPRMRELYPNQEWIPDRD